MTKIWLILLAYFCYCSTTSVALAGAIEFQSESTDKLPALENYFVASDKLITEQANPIDVLFQLKDDRRALMTHLYDRGYFDAYVAIFLNNAPIDNVLVVDAPDEIQSAQVSIRHGKQYKYGAVSVTPLGPKLAAQPAPSGTANLLEIQSYVSDIIDEWRALGYLQTDVAIQELIANHSNQTLDVNVRLNLGAKSVFNKLDLDTPTAVKTTKITEIVALKSGDPINAGTINTIETRLRSTGTFSSVLIEPIQVGILGETDLKLSVSDKKPKRIEATFALSSLDGGSVSAGWTHRNLTGNADQFQVIGTLDGISVSKLPEWSLGASYRQPAIFSDATTNLATELTLGERIYGSDRFRYNSVFIGADRKTTNQIDLSLGINLKRIRNIIQSTAPLISSISTPFQMQNDTRNDRINPQSGSFSELTLTPFRQVDQLTNGLKLTYDVRRYYEINDRVMVAGRLQFGQSFLTNSNAIIDPEFLFFSGGSNTVRGQPYQSLGGDIRGTDLSGAQGMAIGSAEVRLQIVNSLTGVIFADFGYLTPFGWNTPLEHAQNHAGFGLGARYQTALGPIRFDIAHPSKTEISLESMALYFGLGQTF
jgi:translocation and assembly module TamA